MIWDIHPGSRIRFFFQSQIPGSNKLRIPDPDPQHCIHGTLSIPANSRYIIQEVSYLSDTEKWYRTSKTKINDNKTSKYLWWVGPRTMCTILTWVTWPSPTWVTWLSPTWVMTHSHVGHVTQSHASHVTQSHVDPVLRLPPYQQLPHSLFSGPLKCRLPVRHLHQGLFPFKKKMGITGLQLQYLHEESRYDTVT